MIIDCPLCMDDQYVAAQVRVDLGNTASRTEIIRISHVHDPVAIVSIYCTKHRLVLAPPDWPGMYEV